MFKVKFCGLVSRQVLGETYIGLSEPEARIWRMIRDSHAMYTVRFFKCKYRLDIDFCLAVAQLCVEVEFYVNVEFHVEVEI